MAALYKTGFAFLLQSISDTVCSEEEEEENDRRERERRGRERRRGRENKNKYSNCKLTLIGLLG